MSLYASLFRLKARVHPLAILQAMAVYRSGRGVRGAGAWEPSQVVLDALDGGFYEAFSNVVPSGISLRSMYRARWADSSAERF